MRRLLSCSCFLSIVQILEYCYGIENREYHGLNLVTLEENTIADKTYDTDAATPSYLGHIHTLDRFRRLRRRLNIYGKDIREPVETSDFPESVTGKLVIARGYCTATLIGRYYILTAGHCIFEGGAVRDGVAKANFLPNYHQSNPDQENVGVDHLYFKTKYPEKYPHLNYVILRLQKPIGEKYGYAGVSGYKEGTRKGMTLIHYSDDRFRKLPGVDRSCSLHERVDNYILHDCQCARGSNGAAIMKISKTDGNISAVIYALHYKERNRGIKAVLEVDEYDTSNSGEAVPADTFLSQVKQLLREEENMLDKGNLDLEWSDINSIAVDFISNNVSITDLIQNESFKTLNRSNDRIEEPVSSSARRMVSWKPLVLYFIFLIPSLVS